MGKRDRETERPFGVPPSHPSPPHRLPPRSHVSALCHYALVCILYPILYNWSRVLCCLVFWGLASFT